MKNFKKLAAGFALGGFLFTGLLAGVGYSQARATTTSGVVTIRSIISGALTFAAGTQIQASSTTGCTDGTIPYSFSGDTNSGVGRNAADIVSICAGGNEVLTIAASGASRPPLTLGVSANNEYVARFTNSFSGANSFGLRVVTSGATSDSTTVLETVSAGNSNKGLYVYNSGRIGAVGGYFDNLLTALGVTSTDGLVLRNSTVAAAGAQQMSPRLRFDGFGWKTDATAASQAVSFITELLPVQGAAAPTANLLWKYAVNGGAYSTMLTLSSIGRLTSAEQIIAGTDFYATTGGFYSVGGSALILGDQGNNRWRIDTAGHLVSQGAYRLSSGGLTTTGLVGVPNVVAAARASAVVNTGTASVATYTVGAADGTFEVGCNVNVTTSTTHSFSCDVTYTDETNTARTQIIPVSLFSTGSFATGGLITNVTGAGAYSSPTISIRAKAATAITIRTSAGGTFTTVTYNIDGTIKQVS